MPDDRLFESPEALYERLSRLLDPSEPTAARNGRPSDAVWDALAAALQWRPEPGDDRGRKRFAKVVHELTAMGAEPAEIRARASRWRSQYPQAGLTPEALAKHWSSLQGPRPGATPPPAPDEDPDELARRLGRPWA